MGQFGIGQSVRRVEDERLVTGQGAYVDDIVLPRMAHAFLLRTPLAHAVIKRIDVEAARAAPGVIAILTGADCEADGLGGIPALMRPVGVDGKAAVQPPHRLLVRDRVRFVGDRVAMVVAESLNQARDAAERIVVDYEELPAVVTPGAAFAPGAPLIWPDAARNVSYHWQSGDKAAVDAAFARAARIAKIDLVNNRIVANFMETRGAIGQFDRGVGRFTLYTGTQAPHRQRKALAGAVFGEPENRFRVVVKDTGGSFGTKNSAYPEHGLVLWAARKIGRPVKWIAERSEGFLSDSGGRDHETHAELALDADGRFLALRVSTLANLGAYLNNNTSLIPIVGVGMLAGVYMIGAIHVEVRGVFTNTVHTDAYRGAGRPEAAYVIERLIDAAAFDLGMDPAALRRRNYIPPERLPYRTALGLTYDSGRFERNMDEAMRRADWRGFEDRRARAAARGLLRGIGMANYIERCGGGMDESAALRFDPSGAVTLLIGTMANGQGHETAYAQIISDRLGIPFDRIRVLQGDTDIVGNGNGTGGSRSIPVGGAALAAACEKVITKGKRLAAHMLEAAVVDIAFADGVFSVAGTDRVISIADVARASFSPASRPPDMEAGLDERAGFTPPDFTYPNGVHICEVEIDPETGVVAVLRYVVVDDFGVMLNPMLVEGQVHGGVAQGLGQALLEHTVFDSATGQLLSGSLMDYAIPRADDMPRFEFTAFEDAPCLTNPLGMKGAGEAGAIGAPPAAINAIVDALKPYGVRHVDMPATAHRLWHLINARRMEAASSTTNDSREG